MPQAWGEYFIIWCSLISPDHLVKKINIYKPHFMLHPGMVYARHHHPGLVVYPRGPWVIPKPCAVLLWQLQSWCMSRSIPCHYLSRCPCAYECRCCCCTAESAGRLIIGGGRPVALGAMGLRCGSWAGVSILVCRTAPAKKNNQPCFSGKGPDGIFHWPTDKAKSCGIDIAFGMVVLTPTDRHTQQLDLYGSHKTVNMQAHGQHPNLNRVTHAGLYILSIFSFRTRCVSSKSAEQ